MPDAPGKSTTICWECDTVTACLVDVTMLARDGHAIVLALCQDCYLTHWTPLASIPACGPAPGLGSGN